MIIISPFAKKMRNNKPHPKNYPYWKQLIALLPDESIIQIGIDGEEQLVPEFRKNLPLTELAKLVDECSTWISIDSFFQHFCWDLCKPGVVLFGQSDPLIFGHPENVNILKSRTYLREHQFWLWEQAEANDLAFTAPEYVADAVIKLIQEPQVSS